MIPAKGDYLAYFQPPGEMTEKKRVEAWDEKGRPLVVGSKGLVLAETLKGFLHVDEDESAAMAVLPGQGWRVRSKNAAAIWEEDVVAWLVDKDGWATPITPEWHSEEELATVAGPTGRNDTLLPLGPLNSRKIKPEKPSDSD